MKDYHLEAKGQLKISILSTSGRGSPCLSEARGRIHIENGCLPVI